MQKWCCPCHYLKKYFGHCSILLYCTVFCGTLLKLEIMLYSSIWRSTFENFALVSVFCHLFPKLHPKLWFWSNTEHITLLLVFCCGTILHSFPRVFDVLYTATHHSESRKYSNDKMKPLPPKSVPPTMGAHSILEQLGESCTSHTLPPTTSMDGQQESTINGKRSIKIPLSDVSAGRNYCRLTIYEPWQSDKMVYNFVAYSNVSRLRKYGRRYNIRLVRYPKAVLIALLTIARKNKAQKERIVMEKQAKYRFREAFSIYQVT